MIKENPVNPARPVAPADGTGAVQETNEILENPK